MHRLGDVPFELSTLHLLLRRLDKDPERSIVSSVIIMIMIGTCILTMSIQVKDVDKFNHIIANYVFSLDGV
jgi:hypothetical protein